MFLQCSTEELSLDRMRHTFIVPLENAFWVTRGTFIGGIFFSSGASRGKPVPIGALRGGP